MTAPRSFAWPGLGYDPAPGDPAAVGGVVDALASSARRLQETHDALAALTAGRASWDGDAAAAFAATVQELPAHLAGARESCERVRALLDGWRGALDGYGPRARDLEARAVAVRADLAAAEVAHERARRHPDLALAGRTVPADELPAVQARLDAATAGLERAAGVVDALHARLRDLLGAAEVLADEHRTEARRVAEGVRRADDGLAPPEPTWFDDAVGWVGENLGLIGDVAGMISGVFGALALIPVLTPVAGPIALVAGGVAAVAHGAELVVDEDKRADPGAWAGFAADVVGLVPGGRLVVGGAVQFADAFAAAGPGYAAMGGVLGAADGFVGAVDDMGRAGPVAEIVGVRLAQHVDTLTGTTGSVDPTVVAKAAQGTFGVAVQLPTAVSLLDGQDHPVEKNLAAGASIGVTAADEGLEHLARAAAAAT